MSKGRDPTKKKWRNGQRQKGSNLWSRGHNSPYRYIKFPRTHKKFRNFDGYRLSMWGIWHMTIDLQWLKD